MMNFYNQNLIKSILDDLNSDIFNDYLNNLKYWDYRIESNLVNETNKINQKSFIHPKFYDLKENEIEEKELVNSTHFGIGSFISNYYQEFPTRRIYKIKLGLMKYCLKNKIILKCNEDLKVLLNNFGDKYFINIYNECRKGIE